MPNRRQLLGLIAGRATVLTLLLGSGVVMTVVSPGSLPIERDTLLALIGATYGLTVVYVLLLRLTERYHALTDVQLGLDAVVVSVIVYLTGGINSYFSSLYSLPIIAASVVGGRRTVLTVGILSCAMYVAIVGAQYLGVPGFAPAPAQVLPAVKLSLYTVGLNVFGFAAIALLTGYLAGRLEQADIQLQQASDEIEDLQAFGRHIIDSLTSGLATTDIEGRILTFNRAASAITGIPEAEAVGTNAAIVFDLPGELGAFFSTREEHARLPRLDFPFDRRDGRRIELGLSTAVLRTPRGEIGFLLTFQDVTEARRHEREARIQQRLAAVGEMAAGIAHEIRNPLASMAGSMQILRQDLPLTPEQAQLLDIVLRESERLNDTIRSFLAYARPQRNAMTLVDVRGILTDTATLLENSVELRPDHRLAVDVPPNPLMLRADEAQVRQIVWNLATNGLRAMPAGGRLTLAVSGEGPPEARQEVVVRVRDEGTGIPPEDLDGIFQPFRTRFARGTGLGLSIVQRLVADYGGEIQITSAPGEGTTVCVRFPVAATEASHPAVPEKVG